MWQEKLLQSNDFENNEIGGCWEEEIYSTNVKFAFL